MQAVYPTRFVGTGLRAVGWHWVVFGFATLFCLSPWSHAQFGSISGELTATAGTDDLSAPITAMGDLAIVARDPGNPFVQGLASVSLELVNERRFDFEMQSTSISNQPEPGGNPNASAQFNQSFNAAGLQRLTLTATINTESVSNGLIFVTGPDIDLQVVATDGEETISELVSGGSYNLVAVTTTAAQILGTNTSTIDGSFVITPAADLDRDFDVDGSEFVVIQRGFGVANGSATLETGDANEDGNVDDADIVLFESQFSGPLLGTAPAVATVPEPTSLLLTGGLLMTSGLRRWRR